MKAAYRALLKRRALGLEGKPEQQAAASKRLADVNDQNNAYTQRQRTAAGVVPRQRRAGLEETSEKERARLKAQAAGVRRYYQRNKEQVRAKTIARDKGYVLAAKEKFGETIMGDRWASCA